MTKAMLIMDMPSCCKACDFQASNSHDNPICILCTENCVVQTRTKEVYKRITTNISTEKPTWCPLREVPQKQDICGRYNSEYFKNGGKPASFKVGYNACIDEILGGGE